MKIELSLVNIWCSEGSIVLWVLFVVGEEETNMFGSRNTIGNNTVCSIRDRSRRQSVNQATAKTVKFLPVISFLSTDMKSF